MTENFKKLLELISGNEELTARLNNASKEEVIAFARELGITLSDADFEQSGEMSEDELNAVTGGAGISYFSDQDGEFIKVSIGDPDINLKPFHCLFRGIGKIEM